MENKHRIYIGYPCVGKTTASKELIGIIDIDSSLFFIDGERVSNWHKLAVKMALRYLKSGFDIMLTSHKDVCDELALLVKEGVLTTDDVYIIFPSPNLKTEWIEKIKQRYEDTKLYIHKKAYDNCSVNFDEHISSMESYDCFTRKMITNMNYRLVEDIING